jgi:pimeloyl-ACP methyl ester carboxylesterase
MRGKVEYARNDGVSIAYQAIGSGPIDIVFQPGFVSHLDLAWEEPFLARFLNELAAFGRLIWFDKRGTGLSDPVAPDVTVEERVDDIRAVMDAAGSARATLVGVSEGSALCALFAAAHPERVTSLVMWAGFVRLLSMDGQGPGWTAEFFDLFLDGLEQARIDGTGIGDVNASVKGDDRYRDWFVRYLRAAAGPELLRRVLAANAEIDLDPVLDQLTVPTLVVQRVGDPG